MKRQMINERRKLLASIQKILEGPMILLGFVWLILLIIEVMWELSESLEFFSFIIWIIFIIDFLIKFALAPVKLSFLKKNWLSTISLLIPALRLFSILRFIHLVKGIQLIKVVSSLNRSMISLSAAMKRRAFGFVTALTVAVTLSGAGGMYAVEHPNHGFETYGMALWWTAMRIITAGSDFWPLTTAGRGLAFLLSLFGYTIFGYVTATLASFFIGRDAEEMNAPAAAAKDVTELKNQIVTLTKSINELKEKL